MYIDRGLKRERSNKNIFITFMVILSSILSLSIDLLYNKFGLIVLLRVVIQVLIISAIIQKIDSDILVFNVNKNKLRIKQGILYNEDIVICDKISIVHFIKEEDEVTIILVTTTKQRNNSFKALNNNLLNKYPELREKYIYIKDNNSHSRYYFKVFKKGGLKKYAMLDSIYTSSINAVFTDSAIEGVKAARKISEI